MGSQQNIEREQFFDVPVAIFSDFLNTLLSIVCHPRRFFSENYFSEQYWSRKAILYIVIAYALLFITLAFNLTDVSNITQFQLNQMREQFPSNAAQITTFLNWLMQFASNTIHKFSMNHGTMIQAIFQFIFGPPLTFYFLFRIFMWIRKRKELDIFKIINVFSYVFGTVVILFILVILSFSANIKLFVEHMSECKPYNFVLPPSILVVVLVAYFISLLWISLRRALKLSRCETMIFTVLSILVNGWISTYFIPIGL
jgi:hypothetical protein